MKLVLAGALILVTLIGPLVSTLVHDVGEEARSESQPPVPFFSAGERPRSVSREVVTIERRVEPYGNRTASVGGIWLLRPMEDGVLPVSGQLKMHIEEGRAVHRHEVFFDDLTLQDDLPLAFQDVSYANRIEVGLRAHSKGVDFDETRSVGTVTPTGGGGTMRLKLSAGHVYVLVERYSANVPASGLVRFAFPLHAVEDLQRGHALVATWDNFQVEGIDVSLGVAEASHVEEASYRFSSPYCLTGTVGGGPTGVGGAELTLEGPTVNVEASWDGFEFRNAPPGEWVVHYQGDHAGEAMVKAWVSLLQHDCY